MRRFFQLLLLLAWVLAGAYLAFRHSVYFSLFELKAGLMAGDVARVERHAELESMAGFLAELGGMVAERTAEKSAGAAGGAVAKAFRLLLGPAVKEVVSPLTAKELRAAIARKELAGRLGPFVLFEGLSGLGTVEDTPGGKKVELVGRCYGEEAHPWLLLERRDGPLLGFPARYVAKGIDPASMRSFVEACVHGAEGAKP